jgi:hypothetical protein
VGGKRRRGTGAVSYREEDSDSGEVDDNKEASSDVDAEAEAGAELLDSVAPEPARARPSVTDVVVSADERTLPYTWHNSQEACVGGQGFNGSRAQKMLGKVRALVESITEFEEEEKGSPEFWAEQAAAMEAAIQGGAFSTFKFGTRF